MTRRLLPAAQGRLADSVAERVRQVQDHRIRELQRLPAASLKVIPNVALDASTETPVSHGLGRPPLWVRESCPRAAEFFTNGRIEEVRDGRYDRSEVVVLKATGWGTTITVDVLVL